MHVQTWHFPNRMFLRVALQIFLTIGVAPLGFRSLCAEPPVAQDTTVPNTFAFSSDAYFVDQGATNAIINVDFVPGNRSWSGAVDFYTSNGTAQSGIDYQATNGTLYFSGPGTPVPVITIPIYKNDLRKTNVTVELFLSNPSAYLSRPHATLVIVDTNQAPPLQISLPSADSIRLSWPAIYEDFILEKSADLSSASWSAVSSGIVTNNGYCTVFEPLINPPAVYRLRKSAAP